jgi:hypothetical protein
MLKQCLAVVACTVFSGLAWAKPAEVSPVVGASEPVGTGVLKRLFSKIYQAELWTDSRPWSYDAPFALSLTYYWSISGVDLVEKTLTEMRRQSPETADEDAGFAPILRVAFPDVQDGDRITAFFDPQKGVSFTYNGKSKGSIDSVAFARRFFDIWLSPQTSEPELRAQLLGKSL